MNSGNSRRHERDERGARMSENSCPQKIGSRFVAQTLRRRAKASAVSCEAVRVLRDSLDRTRDIEGSRVYQSIVNRRVSRREFAREPFDSEKKRRKRERERKKGHETARSYIRNTFANRSSPREPFSGETPRARSSATAPSRRSMGNVGTVAIGFYIKRC